MAAGVNSASCRFAFLMALKALLIHGIRILISDASRRKKDDAMISADLELPTDSRPSTINPHITVAQYASPMETEANRSRRIVPL